LTETTTDSHVNMQVKQLIGINTECNPSVLSIGDSTIAYVSGHNIVIKSDMSNDCTYIQGVEGCESITAMAVSPGKTLMAVCEKGPIIDHQRGRGQAICIIYDIATQKRRKVLTS